MVRSDGLLAGSELATTPVRRRVGASQRVSVRRLGEDARPPDDRVVAEEPLEIRVQGTDRVVDLGVTMRTPGADLDLAVGWAASEGLLIGSSDLAGARYCVTGLADEQQFNTVTVDLRGPIPAGVVVARSRVVTSACGVCGSDIVADLSARGLLPVEDPVRVGADVVLALPDRLRDEQPLFARTGGIHAAARCSPAGEILAAREDVGRHNAVDKLIGAGLREGVDAWTGQVLLLSGRIGYELVAKAVVARVPVVAAVGAPTSLAVEVAKQFNITLVGFVRDGRGNVYSGAHRIEEST